MAVPDPFTVLGVEPNASREKVEEAFLRLAQIFHPDRYATAPDDVRLEAQRKMSELNAARDAIRSGYQRPVGYESAADAAYRQAYSAATNYSGPFCSICGHSPVSEVEFKVGVGKLIWRELRTWSAPVCRDCGEALYRQTQNETMIKGWWGLLSFFANLYYVAKNWNERKKLASLGPPVRTPKVFLTPTDSPLPSGPPLYQRLGVWVTTTLFVLLGIGGYSESQQIAPGEIEVGDCFLIPESEEVAELTRADCTGDGEVGEIGEVFWMPEYPGETFPSEAQLSSFTNRECDRMAEYEWEAFTPTEEAWDSGNHGVVCYYPLTE